MKYLLFTIALFLCANITAQELPKKSKTFVRVYNNQGEKIAKGKILDITDNSLTLKKGSNSITIPLSEIATLKTKRSNGNNVLFGAVGGSLLGLGIVASNSGPC
jgi:RNase P/RNase MRP subunit p29